MSINSFCNTGQILIMTTNFSAHHHLIDLSHDNYETIKAILLTLLYFITKKCINSYANLYECLEFYCSSILYDGIIVLGIILINFIVYLFMLKLMFLIFDVLIRFLLWDVDNKSNIHLLSFVNSVKDHLSHVKYFL